MTFAEPRFLFLLLVLPFLAWLVGRGQLKQRAQQTALAFVLGDRSGESKQRIVWLLEGLAVVALVLALARPSRPDPPSVLGSGRTDWLVLLDISASMQARDGAPTREDAARRALDGVLEAAEGDRFAAILFAAEARLAVPLTADLRGFRRLLDAQIGQDPVRGGSLLESALALAITQQDPEPGRVRRVILFGDGEDFGARQRCIERARQLDAAGVSLIAVCCGRPESTVLMRALPSGAEEPYRDASGGVVETRAEPDFLAEVAAAAGGWSTSPAGLLPRLRVEPPTPGREDGSSSRQAVTAPLLLLAASAWLLARAGRSRA